MGNSKSSEWLEKFNEIKSNHDKAFLVISEGLDLEEQQNSTQALEKYKEGLNLIDKAFKVQVSMPENTDYYWEKALRMIQKMKKTCKIIQERLLDLQEENDSSYDPVTNSNNNCNQRNISELYSDFEDETLNFALTIKDYDSHIIFTYYLVTLFFVTSSGIVRRNYANEKLVIAAMETISQVEETNKSNSLQFFVKLGKNIFPLINGICPCYINENQIYVLPDLNGEMFVEPSCIGFKLEQHNKDLELIQNIFKNIQTVDDLQLNNLVTAQELKEFEEDLVNHGKMLDEALKNNNVEVVKLQCNELTNAFFCIDHNIFGTMYNLIQVTHEEMLSRYLENNEKSQRKVLNEKIINKLYPDLSKEI